MLLTLLKVLFFFGVVLAASLGAMHLAQTGHPLTFIFDGTEYVLGPIQAAVALVLAALAGWLAVKLLGIAVAFIRFLAGDRTAIDRYFDRRRERKGYQALAEGMLAVASGEGRLAQDKAALAARYLDQPHLTNLLSAQAAELQGDAPRADAVYRTMLTDQRTRFVAIRGLMQRQIALGDNARALALAQQAYALRPANTEVQDTLLGLQTRSHDWKGARRTLRVKRQQGTLPKDVHVRRDAVLALQEARDVLAEGASISAREAAISANRASPDLVPAAVLAARSYIAQGDSRNASRLLQRAWAAQPHPSLAAAYAEIVPDESPVQRLRRFDDLVRQAPGHEETRLLQAELALAAEDFPAARRALGDLPERHPTVRSLALMAAVERGRGADEAAVRGWLTRAMTASRGPQWVCDKCQNVMTDWSPVCDSCGGFDTLSWREPPATPAVVSAAGDVSLLPLLTGAPTRGDDGPVPVPLPAVSPPATYPAPAGGASEIVVAQGAPDPSLDTTAPPAAVAEPVAGPAARTEVRELARVTPGMVPREADYVPVETIRTPYTPTPVVGDGVMPPVRPDVEPPSGRF